MSSFDNIQKEIFKKIQNTLKETGKTQKDLCSYLQISPQSFSEWKAGRSNSYKKYIDQIAEYLDVSTDYLLGKTDTPERMEDYFTVIDMPEQKLLPIFGLVSAGTGCFADEDILGYESADKKYCDGEHFWLRVKGDSMSPRIQDGDLVLVRKQSSVDSGDIGVFLVDGEDGYVKKVRYSENHIILSSFNSMYKDIVFECAEVQRVRVLGKVIELKAKF
ncbi:MAG: helix-turn-helix domain-containing protein [Clostridia bacterium]|nr:helix-turn-helix domain-containing protein [Clostridia bacterium]